MIVLMYFIYLCVVFDYMEWWLVNDLGVYYIKNSMFIFIGKCGY